jgi:hypothetical protein
MDIAADDHWGLHCDKILFVNKKIANKIKDFHDNDLTDDLAPIKASAQVLDVQVDKWKHELIFSCNRHSNRSFSPEI